jgi:voltage-gated potassium channel
VSTYVLGVAVMIMGLAAVAVLDVGRDAPGASFTILGDGLWWSATTVITVG